MSKKKIWESFWGKGLVLTVLGTLILAFGTATMILPFGLISGGISSFSLIANRLCPLIGSEVWVLLFSYGLYVLGAIFLGRDFAVKTMASTLLFPLAVAVFTAVSESEVAKRFFDMMIEKNEPLLLLIVSVLSGIFIGGGCAVTFLGGGSSGGVDILAFLICKKFPALRHSIVIFMIDFAVIFFGIFVTKDISKSLLGILSAVITSAVIDMSYRFYYKK